MIKIRRSAERGHFDHHWLNTFHTFSFGDYFDDKQMGFQALRVINEDFVQPGQGFPTHGHRNMEIITYIIEGELQHKDNMGNTSVIKPGDAQRMSAGRGVQHSEANPSRDNPVHLLQIWILPRDNGTNPSYEQKHFPIEARLNKLALIGSSNGEAGSIKIFQDVKLYSTILENQKSVEYNTAATRSIWIQVAKGSLNLNGETLSQGDGVAIQKMSKIHLAAMSDAEFLLFDLA